MHALLSTSDGWCIQSRPTPPLPRDQVRVSMVLGGLCRTDIAAMTKKRKVPEGLVLGHEGAGVVEYIPPSLEEECALRQVFVGTRVAIWPFVPCGQCVHGCQRHLEQCLQPQVLGLHRDGLFASHVDVPLNVLFPSQLPWKALAYAEPLAAALAVLNVPDVLRAPDVAVLGQGRIAQVCAWVLNQTREKQGFSKVILASQEEELPLNLDAVVETTPNAHLIDQAVRRLRFGGLLVVKSRPPSPVLWPHEAITLKALHVQGAPYARFTQALSWLEQHTHEGEAWWGDVFPLTPEGVQEALIAEQKHQERAGKLFFDLTRPGSSIAPASIKAS